MQEKRLGYLGQGGITCGAIEKASKSLKASDERVLINFRYKMPFLQLFATKMVFLIIVTKCLDMS